MILGCKAYFCCLKLCLWRFRLGLLRWHACLKSFKPHLGALLKTYCAVVSLQEQLLEILQNIGMNGHILVLKWKKQKKQCLDCQSKWKSSSVSVADNCWVSHQKDSCEVLHLRVLHFLSRHHLDTFPANCPSDCICELCDGKKFALCLTAYPTDNRLLCRTIKSHSGRQRPNIPLTLSFENRPLTLWS